MFFACIIYVCWSFSQAFSLSMLGENVNQQTYPLFSFAVNLQDHFNINNNNIGHTEYKNRNSDVVWG